MNEEIIKEGDLVPCSCGNLTKYRKPYPLEEQLCEECQEIMQEIMEEGGI